MEKIQEILIQKINENSEFVHFGEFGKGVSDSWIMSAQERLNIKFSPSYIWWLKNWSGGEVGSLEIYSIYEIPFDEVTGGDIVYVNETNWKNGLTDKSQLAICEDDEGGIFYFNLNIKNPYGEYPVFYDITGEKFAENFIEFLLNLIG